MKKFILLFLFTISATAQIKGVVRDSITKEPIAYVALVYENTSIGTNSNEKGEFELPNNEAKTTISCLGYHSKTIKLNSNNEILLSVKATEINEVIITKRKNNSEIVVGNFKNSVMGFGNYLTGNVWAKYISFTKEIAKHPFIKKIEFTTRSDVKNAKLKLRFFYADAEGKPSEDYIYEEIIITVKKGKHKNVLNVENYNILIPKEGLFLGFENLIIEENKYEYIYTKEGEKGKFKGISYEPTILGYEAKECNVWIIKNNVGRLFKEKFKKDSKPIELGVKLTLTN